jgi:hypothetical protein
MSPEDAASGVRDRRRVSAQVGAPLLRPGLHADVGVPDFQVEPDFLTRCQLVPAQGLRAGDEGVGTRGDLPGRPRLLAKLLADAAELIGEKRAPAIAQRVPVFGAEARPGPPAPPARSTGQAAASCRGSRRPTHRPAPAPGSLAPCQATRPPAHCWRRHGSRCRRPASPPARPAACRRHAGRCPAASARRPRRSQSAASERHRSPR